jgi:predicted RNA-binding Zn-ribbon protein involved in translation (DUF1610 family)
MNPLKSPCPSCGAEVEFKSNITVFNVCPFCRSTIVRHDLKLETLGKMAELPEDMTPFQVGTRGKYDGKAFELLGRVKLSWDDGSWNEWFASFSDGREGWLAEAQGMYMMSFLRPEITEVPPVRELKPGKSFPLGGPTFKVDDIKRARCVGSEGELPFQAPEGRESVSVDLSGPDSLFATIEYSITDGIRVFTGKSVDFDALELAELRELEGWS